VQQTKKNQSLALSRPPTPRHQSLETTWNKEMQSWLEEMLW
jgi:hypothetical protein